MRLWVTAAVVVCTALGSARAQQRPEDIKGDVATPGKRVDVRGEDRGFIGGTPILEIDQCPGHDQMTQESLVKAANEHFARGEVLYVQGDYHGAVTELVSAYCYSPYWAVLKDIGQAYERELDYEKAIAYFEKYVRSVPPDAPLGEPVRVDPQVDKENINARIKVLSTLRAKIRVNTDPPEAEITLTDYQGTISARGKSGDELAVLSGHYTVSVAKEGFRDVSTEIDVEIGKPYTIFSKLEASRGRLHVRVEPANARMFLQYPNGDKLQVGDVGTGIYEGQLPGGKYRLYAEADGRVTVSRDIDVLPDKDTPISMDLPPVPQFGRRQLIVYSTIAGGVALGGVTGVSSRGDIISIGGGTGLIAGFVGSYYLVPHDIPLGTSSLTITASMIGGFGGLSTTQLFTGQGNIQAPIAGAGVIIGAGVGYAVGSRAHITPGDAAIINSGAIWGSVTGLLFSGSFDADRKTAGGLALSGLGMGTIGGVLVTRYYKVGRTHAALIDVGGIVGLLTGVGIGGVVSNQTNTNGTTSSSTLAGYSLGGMITGLLAAGILTRNFDIPDVSVAPTVSKTQGGTTTIGFGGAW